MTRRPTAPRPPRAALRRPTLAVLAFIVVLSAGAWVIADRVVSGEEHRNLDDRTKEAASLLGNLASQIDTTLRVLAGTVRATGGDPAAFEGASVRDVAGGRFEELMLVRSDAAGRLVVVSVQGSRFRAGDAVTGRPAAALAAAAEDAGMVTTGVFAAGEESRLGFAIAALPGRWVYAEAGLDPLSQASVVSGKPFSAVKVAFYAGSRSEPSQLVLATTSDLPLRGTTAEVIVPVGSERWLVVVQPRRPLVGAVAHAMPWIFLVLGLATAAIVALLLEVVQRRREYAETLVRDRTRQLAGVLEVATASTRSLELAKVLDASLASVARVTGARAAALYLGAGGSRGFKRAALLGDANGLPARLTRHAPAPPEDGDATQIPLAVAGESVGVLVLVGADSTDPTLAATLGAEVAIAIQNAQRFEREHQAARRLADASRMKSVFLATVSHELRTPLTVILGMAATVQQRALPPEQAAQLLDRIVVAGERLRVLVDDLLEATNIESGRLAVTASAVDVAAVVERSVESFRGRRREIALAIPPGVPPVTADPGRLEQVLNNVIDNAVKYSPDRSEVRVAVEADGPIVELSVSDHGRGIEPEFLPRIFDPFSQSDEAGAGARHGVGLGMYITRGLVEAMGGTIEVESTLGSGTTVTVRLRAAEEGAGPERPLARPLNDGAVAPHPAEVRPAAAR